MPEPNKETPQPATSELIEAKLRLLEVWSLWLWGAAIVILLLLSAWVNLVQRLLLASVLLFAVFAVYQQLLANRLRRQLAAQTIAALNSRTEVLEELSMIDPLTGLFNRRFAAQRLPHEMTRADRQNHPLTLLMLDLDNFKAINDSFGHAAGDAALQAFATTLRKAVRGADLPVRFGGDEFMVLLPECNMEQVSFPSRLQSCTFEFAGARVPVEFSAGWAQRQTGESAESLLQRADRALYQVKRARHNAGAQIPT